MYHSLFYDQENELSTLEESRREDRIKCMKNDISFSFVLFYEIPRKSIVEIGGFRVCTKPTSLF